ncbi:hypothetical protein A2635_03515 [Candidatus Peribacteria bacterium RIFCSPHIGHO2_01_FULL_51_9]|nr:MAG: hypothetical protein A2635_03515 [Candidatus Peribacteria bacterium RIFCSPHIGHO2_01_FULL_51_9]
MPRKKDDPQVSSSSSEYFTRADKEEEGVKRVAEEEGVHDNLGLLKIKMQVEHGEDAENVLKGMQEEGKEEEVAADKDEEPQKMAGTKSLLTEVKEEVEDAKEKSTTDNLVKKEKKQRAIERKMAQEGEIQQEAG